MKPDSSPITGRESHTEDDTAYNALIDFYKAFNNKDWPLMALNWLHDSTASLANPLGGLRRGWEEISLFYQQLFLNPAQVYVEYYDYTIHRFKTVFLAVGRERGFFRTTDTEVQLHIRTSRTYTLTSTGWKQLHHHGSIEQPDLLKRYQQTVFHTK